MAEQLTIGVDIGGTNLRCGLVDGAGSIVERRRCASRIEDGRDAFCQRLFDEIDTLRHIARKHECEITGIGLGIPGLVGADGLIHSSVNMRPLEGLNLAGSLRERYGLPTISANDANLIALGEQRYGAGKGFSSCMVITIGTGLGSGLILDDRIWGGKGGFAAEFGHITFEPEGLPCPCGNNGCLEQYVSASALVRYFKELSTGEESAGQDAAQVAELAQQGNQSALTAYRRLGYSLGTALASLINTLNIEAIVIAGGVSESFDLFSDALREQLQRRAFRQMSDSVVVNKALLGDDAGLLGGAALATKCC